jgi:hypothetical protein
MDKNQKKTQMLPPQQAEPNEPDLDSDFDISDDEDGK